MKALRMIGCFANISSYQGPMLRIVSTTKNETKTITKLDFIQSCLEM